MPEHTIAENLARLQNAKTAIGAAITAKGGTVSQGDGLEEFAADIATITNQYTQADEGKVVSSGALVAQTDYGTVTENGTYNTTENNSVTVDVPPTTNSGIAYPTGSTTGYIIVSIFGTELYVSTKLSDTSSSDRTATFQSPFQLSDFIDTDLSLTLEGFRNSSASTYTMNVTLKPGTNQIVYRTSSSLSARSLFSGSASI